MKGRNSLKKYLLLGISFFLLSSCRSEETSPAQGVELGNPSGGGTSVRIVPDEGDFSYQVALSVDSQAVVEKYLMTETAETFVESVTVPYQETDDRWSLSAHFLDGSTVKIEGTFNQQRVVSSVTFRIDDREVSSCFEQREQVSRCRIRTTTRVRDTSRQRDGSL